MNRLLEASRDEADGGALVGRDPRRLTPDDFTAAGIKLLPVMRAIRANCIDCCGGQSGEVRKCVATACPLWPLRMGVFPARLRAYANAQAEAATEINGPLRPCFEGGAPC